MEVLLDINILIDSLTQRQPFAKEADAVMQANDAGTITGWIAAFTAPTMFYLLRKELARTMPQAQATLGAFSDVQTCLTVCQICTVDRLALEQALLLGGDDYEDNLQLACAMINNLDAIVTRDKKFHASRIPVLSPSQLLQQLGR